MTTAAMTSSSAPTPAVGWAETVRLAAIMAASPVRQPAEV